VRPFLASAETNIPVANEKKSVLAKARAMRQNSPPVTPPINKGMPVIGNKASRP
jgi:hypothetical protein